MIAQDAAPSQTPAMSPNESSRPRWGHLEYRWRLENFWELRALASIEALEDDGGDVVWSRQFGDRTSGLWRLKIYPYGDSSQGGKGHVSLFLSLDIKAMEIVKAYAIFGCYVLDSNGQKITGSGRSFTRQKFAEGSSSWGWSQFIKVESQTLTRMLVDDALTIKCDIDVFLGVKAGPGRELPQPLSLTEELTKFVASEDALDVAIKCGNVEYRANRFVLAARSKVLWSEIQKAQAQGAGERPVVAPITVNANNTAYTSFGDPPEEPKLAKGRLTSSPPQIAMAPVQSTTEPGLIALRLSDVAEDIAGHMLDFITTDKCVLLAPQSNPDLMQLLDLFLASARYQVTSLFNAIVEVLLGRINTKKDATAILRVAEGLGCGTLITESRSFLQFMAPEIEGEELLRLIAPKKEATSPLASA